jgi:hypothetical protein
MILGYPSIPSINSNGDSNRAGFFPTLFLSLLRWLCRTQQRFTASAQRFLGGDLSGNIIEDSFKPLVTKL